jgi:hypothetical protein
MAAFCEIADLEAFLQVSIGTPNASAEAAIAAASAAIQNYTRQRIEQVASDVLTLTVEAHRSVILLPEQPVTAVASVVEDGTALTVGTDYRWTSAGLLVRQSRVWNSGWQEVVITYTHGYATIPDDLKGVCIRAAAREYQAGLRAAAAGGIAGIQSEQLPDYSVSFTPETASGQASSLGASAAPILLPTEKQVLDRYRMSV